MNAYRVTDSLMPDFVDEDDLDTFEGWLKYQSFGDLTPDQLATCRSQFDDMMANRAPPVGLMKLKPGEHRYAVAVRDGSDLWLTLWIRRAAKGDVYVLIPRGDREWDPHTTYHRDGTFHAKSYGAKLDTKKRQPLTAGFRGAEHLGGFMGHGPKRVGAMCNPSAYTGVVEVPPGILGPRNGAVVIDLVEPGLEPRRDLIVNAQVILHQTFREVSPWLVVRVTR